MIPREELKLRPAVLPDQRDLANLLHFSKQVHRHLDWRNPLDWIGSSPYLVMEYHGEIIAAMACPQDPPKVAWVRMYVNSGKIPARQSWQMLWERAQLDLAGKGWVVVAAIVLQDWIEEIFQSSAFTSHQSIVMLEREGDPLERSNLPKDLSIRAMMPYDLPAVAGVDASAFELLWQNSLPALEHAYPQAVIATVAELHGEIIGYQLSTRNPYGIHLARLAVQPDIQGQGIGYALVADLIQQTSQRGLARVTVNTQSDNSASLALYRRMGFQDTGEIYPVYQFQLS